MKDLEDKIDELTFDLYDLTEEERELIKNGTFHKTET